MLLQLTGLYASSFILGQHQTYVIDSEAEFIYYQPLKRGLMLALALQGGGAASLREGRRLHRSTGRRTEARDLCVESNATPYTCRAADASA